MIKYSANQKYTTTGLTAGLFQAICQKAGVPVQVFANRADEPGGSTLGNLLGHQVSIPMVDIGMAQLAMHSAVETAGSRDPGTWPGPAPPSSRRSLPRPPTACINSDFNCPHRKRPARLTTGRLSLSKPLFDRLLNFLKL